MKHLVTVNAKNIGAFMAASVDKASSLHTDERNLYPGVCTTFARRETVNHGAKEFARGKGANLVTTNWAEGYFGVFKRGMTGV